MKNEIIIAPSILSADFANLQADIQKIEKAGADWVHIDVMDGHFVPNITIGPQIVKSLRKTTGLIFDVHLMIENPEKYIDEFAKAGSDYITVHYEACKDNLFEVIEQIKRHNIKAGVSIKPKTPASAVIDILGKIDLLLIMSVEPGFGGQKYIPESTAKIKEIKDNAPQGLIIEVDGGINDLTAKEAVNAGANALVAGAYVYNSQDIASAIKKLR